MISIINVSGIEYNLIRCIYNKCIFFIEWKTGHVYNANYLFRIATTDITELQPSIPAGTIVINWKR